jgi:hypothetical protein
MKILAIDPSGNFNEGKGTTGWCLLDENCKLISVGQLMASECNSKEEHWMEHLDLIKHLAPDYIVVEDYLLYANKSQSQINSRFETSRLIGAIELYCWTNNIPLRFQKASDVKQRFTDERLVQGNYISKSSSCSRYFAAGVLATGHIRDAIRHGVYFVKFKLKKEMK